MSKEKRLGKGLAALLGTPVDEQTPAAEADAPEVLQFPQNSDPATESGSTPSAASAEDTEQAELSDLMQLSVFDIDDNPFQPRREFSESEIASLSESLKEHDMLQPVLVRRVGGRYQLISGERRLRAAIQAGWQRIPARVREADDRLVAELAIVENLQRKDLNPIEKAMSFKRYIDEHDCKQEDLAQRLKIDRSTIANLMRLLELPREILDHVTKGDLSAGHARALLPLGEEDQQIEFGRSIRRDGWSVRETERKVQETILAEDGSPEDRKGARKSRTKNKQIASLEQELKIALGARVEIKQSSRQRGQIVIHFTSHDEFDRLREYLTDSGRLQQNAG